jgi:hypothetical protein
MTSLGNYASASVLSCNDLIVRNLTNTITPVYGVFDLSQAVVAIGTLTTIGNWKPTSIIKGVSVQAGVQGNEKFYVTQAGLYEVQINLEVDNGVNDILIVESRVVLFPSTDVAGGSISSFSATADWRKFTQYNAIQFEITDPITQYFEIQGRCGFGGSSPDYEIPYTKVFVRKLI